MEHICVPFHLVIHLAAGVSESQLLLSHPLEMTTTSSLFEGLTTSIHSLVPSATASLKQLYILGMKDS